MRPAVGPAELSTVGLHPAPLSGGPRPAFFATTGAVSSTRPPKPGSSIATAEGSGVVACDVDGDGLVDVFVANDMTANFLFRNKGGMKFEETGLESGVGASELGGYQAGMGVACGDVDGRRQARPLGHQLFTGKERACS